MGRRGAGCGEQGEIIAEKSFVSSPSVKWYKKGLRIYEFSQPTTSETNVDNSEKTILNNSQILEIRNIYRLGAANISEIANLYRLPEEIIERILAKV